MIGKRIVTVSFEGFKVGDVIEVVLRYPISPPLYLILSKGFYGHEGSTIPTFSENLINLIKKTCVNNECWNLHMDELIRYTTPYEREESIYV